MSIIRDFLLWLEEHQTGILTTIAVHLLIICAILIMKIRTNIEREYTIMIDFSQIDFDMEEILSEENLQQQIIAQELQQDNILRNIPVNVADQRAVESIERMIREIKEEENIVDPQHPQDVPAETTTNDNESFYNERLDNNVGERTVYTGQTTVSYDLAGRRHTYMPRPSYRCRSGGTIVVNITVNGSGYVIDANINVSRSNSEDPCHINAAIQDAQRSRFNESPIARQQGTITYIFQAQ